MARRRTAQIKLLACVVLWNGVDHGSRADPRQQNGPARSDCGPYLIAHHATALNTEEEHVWHYSCGAGGLLYGVGTRHCERAATHAQIPATLTRDILPAWPVPQRLCLDRHKHEEKGDWPNSRRAGGLLKAWAHGIVRDRDPPALLCGSNRWHYKHSAYIQKRKKNTTRAQRKSTVT